MKLDRCVRTMALLGCSLFFSLTGCRSDEHAPPVLRIPAEELRLAPQRIMLGDREYVLETELWRDFMPVSPPDGKPLIALIRVVEQNGNPIPPDLKLEYLWVINGSSGSQIWATDFSDEPLPPPPGNELHGIARDGPKWGPQIQVDVVVGLRLGTGFMELLRAPNQWIERTE